MFGFSESEYKWCPQCAGNIRKQANYCRFCKKAINNKLLKDPVVPAVFAIDAVSQWLPDFNSLTDKISLDLKGRFEKADIDTPAPTIGVPSHIDPIEYRQQNRESEVCPPEPPEAHVAGLIYDILLSIFSGGENLTEICQHPRLKLLEVTPQEVVAEYELRKQEIDKGYQCDYCAEFVILDDDKCRFCGGTADKRPERVVKFFEKEIDRAFLKDVIAYESAWRIICGATPIDDKILETNAITLENLDQEILRQRSPDAAYPMPRFYKRMSELGLTSYWTPESLSISRLVDLGSALDEKRVDRTDEAMIVYEHALKRTEGQDELIYERGRVFKYMSFLYQRKDDYAQYKKYNEMAQECETFGMSDEMKELMLDSNIDKMALLNADLLAEDDPEKRLAQLDEMLGGSTKQLDKMLEHMNNAVPGLGEAMAGLTGKLNNEISSTRLLLEAEIARRDGDLALSESKYSEALETNQDEFMGASKRSDLLCSLAEVKHLQGDDVACEKLLLEAATCANEYYEAMPEFGKTSLWSTEMAFACFFRDTKKYEESEAKFALVIKMQEETTNEAIEKYGGDRKQYSRETARVKEEYGRLLRLMHKTQEAERIELEVERLKGEADEEDARLKKHRTNMAQQMRDGLESD